MYNILKLNVELFFIILIKRLANAYFRAMTMIEYFIILP